MGQKVNPVGLRLGINRTWESRWFSKKDYAKNLHEDLLIRSFLKNRLRSGEVSRVEIIRYPEKINVIVHTARPLNKAEINWLDIQALGTTIRYGLLYFIHQVLC